MSGAFHRLALVTDRAGAWSRKRGRYARARRFQLAALKLAEAGVPRGDARLVPFLNNLGVACKFAGRFDDAMGAYTRALALADSGKQDPDAVATLLHNLGGLEHARGRPEAGEPHARLGLERRRVLFGADHPSIAEDLAALGALVADQGRLDEAEHLYREALSIWQRLPRQPAAEIASTLTNLAAVQHRRGETADAERHYRRALALKEAVLGAGHPDVAITANNLGLLLCQAGRIDEAAALYRSALDIAARRLGPHHPIVTTVRANLDRCRDAPPAEVC